jgi:D-serine deaminase-like pyridoxal phosphate-dependent protein
VNTYAHYRAALQGEPLPCAFVDLDAVDRNLETLLAPVRASGKTLRMASKSLRCVSLMKHLFAQGGDALKGVMCFSATEAAWLAGQGFDDLFVAYPTGQASDAQLLADANRGDATIGIMVDSTAHLDLLDGVARASDSIIPVVVEVDTSYRPFGPWIHVGARRSPLRTPAAVLALCEDIAGRHGLRLQGVMGYESHIAGVQDDSPFVSGPMNAATRWMKRRAHPHVVEVRARIAAGLRARGIAYDLFNGGGTGSLGLTVQEPHLTEVTAGSGFVDSHLFDYFKGLELTPAIGFALQVVRRPDERHVTCHGGGYVASGAAGPDRLPVPWLPTGLRLLGMEGTGEVQTPLQVPKRLAIGLGDPVFFRHAKAGELAEHFTEYLFLRGQGIVERAPTYRGSGRCFLG